MILLLILVLLIAPYMIMWSFRDQQADNQSPAHPRRAYLEPLARTQTMSGADGLAWSDLDDRQLTRLLTDSAPRTTTEQNP